MGEISVIDGESKRIIQEFVPGTQITLAHLIANPQRQIYRKLGLPEESTEGAIGIMTLTPGEATIIAADVASKSADIQIEFIDRFSGALLMTGDVSSVEAALKGVLLLFEEQLHYTLTTITRS